MYCGGMMFIEMITQSLLVVSETLKKLRYFFWLKNEK